MTLRLRTVFVLNPLIFTFFFLEAFLSQSDELFELFESPFSWEREDIYVRKVAPEGTFPFYVSLRRARLDMHYCAGTLISPSYILTSASCMDSGVFGFGVANATALVSAYHLESEEEDEGRPRNRRRGKQKTNVQCDTKMLNISKVVMHEKYSNGTDEQHPYNALYDIAVVKLAGRSFANWSALPLEIPNDCCDGVDFVSTGLGRAVDAGPYATSLEMATFPFMPYDQCAEFFRKSADEFLGGDMKNMSRESSICVRGDMNYCQPDWGSGLFHWMGNDKPPVLIGFASKATRECSYGDPYVFTNVSYHMEWILGIEGLLEDIAGAVRSTQKCGKKQRTTKISRAALVLPGQYPYSISVRLQGNVHLCNGVLISPRHVLTVGSCVNNQTYLNSSRIEVYIGGIEISPDKDSSDFDAIPVSQCIFHKRRFGKPRQDVDMAILVLEHNSTNPPIQLPFQNHNCCRHDMPLHVVGWGPQSEVSALSQYLHAGPVNFVTRKKCKKRYNGRSLNSTSICAGNNETGIGAELCRGGDGTPLILTGGAHDVLIGLAFCKASGGCCGPQPVEFLKVALFREWINKQVSVT